MQQLKRSFPILIVLFALVAVCAVPVLAGGQDDGSYEFLAELATINPLEGFSPQLFQPESQPSRFEIAYFLYCFDNSLSIVAAVHHLDLTGALAQLWLSANPGAGSGAAETWASWATGEYQRLLLEYHQEMADMGYSLGNDGFPAWSQENVINP